MLEKHQQTCDSQNKDILLAKYEPISNSVFNSMKLPDELESRLHNLMDNIAIENNSLPNRTFPISNIVPLKLMGSFGITFDHGNDTSYDKLKILTVSPFSVASQIKLASGDVIVNLDNKVDLATKDSANNKFQRYIDSLNIGGPIEILVRRDKKEYLLTGKYLPTILPESHYQIYGNNNAIEQSDLGCALVKKSVDGSEKEGMSYEIFAHNGKLLSDIYGKSSLSHMKVSPGLHIFNAFYSPYEVTDGGNRGETKQGEMGSYGPSDDIAPRIRGGNKARDGVKSLIHKRTGSISGWFQGSSNSNDNNYNGRVFKNLKSRRSKGVDFNYLENLDDDYFNGLTTDGINLVNITLNVKKNNTYKIKIEDGINKKSTFESITTLATNEKIDCGNPGVELVLSPLLAIEELLIVKDNPPSFALQFELDQLLLEIKTYYQANVVTSGVVDIYRSEKVVKSYGVIGKMVDLGDNYFLLVKQVKKNSMASLAGLKEGDKILEFNHTPFENKQPKELLNGLAKLSYGQEYNLLIKRNGKKQSINAKFVKKVFPAFHLSVDMNSVVKAQQAISIIIEG